MLFTGVAFADRGRHRDHDRGRDRGHRSGPVVRDHRGPDRPVVRNHRQGPSRVRVTNGRYVFPGGVVRVYKKPKHRRYYNRHVRPAIIVEQYDPVPGYVWVQGSWSWAGSEWMWTPGYWSTQAVVVAPPPPPPRPRPPAATVQGGISVNAGISIR